MTVVNGNAVDDPNWPGGSRGGPSTPIPLPGSRGGRSTPIPLPGSRGGPSAPIRRNDPRPVKIRVQNHVTSLVRAINQYGPVGFLKVARELGWDAKFSTHLLEVYRVFGRAGLIEELTIRLGGSGASMGSGATSFEDHPAIGGANTSFQFLLYRGSQTALFTRTRKRDRCYFPVNPEDITQTSNRSSSTFEIVNGRQAMQIGQRALRSYTFSSFFPADYDRDYCNGEELDKTPKESVRWIWSTMASDSPVMFGALGDIVFSSMPCFVTSFTPTYRAGSPRDIFFDIELQEAVIPTVVVVGSAGSASIPDPKDDKYKTVAGDTLTEIAQRQYGRGNGRYWTQIRQVNPNVVGEKGDKQPGPDANLKAGQTLKIPKVRSSR